MVISSHLNTDLLLEGKFLGEPLLQGQGWTNHLYNWKIPHYVGGTDISAHDKSQGSLRSHLDRLITRWCSGPFWNQKIFMQNISYLVISILQFPSFTSFMHAANTFVIFKQRDANKNLEMIPMFSQNWLNWFKRHNVTNIFGRITRFQALWMKGQTEVIALTLHHYCAKLHNFVKTCNCCAIFSPCYP